MSRRTISIDDDRYVVVGWDPPLQSYFWQVYNGKDDSRILELEIKHPNSKELADLYKKYDRYGGEPLIADSCLGDPRKIIPDVVELQKQIKDYLILSAETSAALIEDKKLNR